jgi:hypothetical protein
LTIRDYKGQFPNAELCDGEWREKFRRMALDRGAIPPNLSFQERSRARIGKKITFRYPKERGRRISIALRNSSKRKVFDERMKVERLGPNNPCWKGGCKPAVLTIPFPEQEKIKAKIRERDNHSCVICGQYLDGYEEWACIHHINHDQTDWREENLVTMCNRHHSATNHGKTIEEVKREFNVIQQKELCAA